MKISAKTDYACRALLELSLHWPKKEPLSINLIAQRQQIPIKFLTHILLSLKNLGLVNSVRGKEGGYLLAKAPSEIKLNDVLIYGVDFGFKKSVKTGHICHVIWQEIDEKLKAMMAEVTFEDIIQRERSRGKVPMYTI